MPIIKHFEDLHCWQNARQLSKTVFTLKADKFNKDFSTRDQFRRATLSIMNNIAEGFARFSAKERIRFLEIAQSSAAEVISMLYLFEDIEYLEISTIEKLRAETVKIRKQILAFMKVIR